MTLTFKLVKPLLLSLAAFAAVYGCHFGRLAETTHASGWDAYFYLVQVKAMVEEGNMHSPDISPVYYILKYIYWICGDYELAFQILCAGLASLFSALLSTIAYQQTRSIWVAGILGLWCVASPSLAYFGANFPKNLLGIDCMLLLFWASSSHTRLLQIPALILAAISHRLTAALSIAYIAFKRFSWKTIAILSGTAIAGLLIASLIPGMIHWSDLERFDFRSIPHFPAWSAIELLDLWHTQPSWAIEIIVLQLIFILAGWTLIRKSKLQGQDARQQGIFGLILLLTFPFLEMSPTSMGYRFFLTSLLIIPILAIPLLSHIQPLAQKSMALALLIAAIATQPHITPQQFDPDYEYYHSLSQRAGNYLKGTEAELVIAHNGLAEVFTFKNEIDAMPWVPEYEVDPEKLYRIVFGIEAFEIKAVLGRELRGPYKRLDPFYLILTEKDWQDFVTKTEQIGEDEELLERIYAWENPSQKRPTFLLRNQSDQ